MHITIDSTMFFLKTSRQFDFVFFLSPQCKLRNTISNHFYLLFVTRCCFRDEWRPEMVKYMDQAPGKEIQMKFKEMVNLLTK